MPTNAQGQIEFINLSPGEYKAIETAAAQGYIAQAVETEVLTIDESNAVITTTVENTPYVNVEILKVDDETNNGLANATFQLYKQNAAGEFEAVAGGLFVTGSQGQALIEKLSIGKYRLVETEAPTGYAKRTAPIEFEVTREQLQQPGSTVKLAPIPNSKLVIVPAPNPNTNPSVEETPKPNPSPTPNTGTTTPRPNTTPSTQTTTRPTASTTPTVVTAGPTSTLASVEQRRLPQTSVSNSIWVSTLGALLIFVVSTVFVARRRRM